ncbi:hypothetical protein GGS21DRAFT_332135 [Xylaria nigripes]|nr:hypothetical protein GGS21DRAFT_332135 [Xylaria nigripes]
MAAMEFPEFGSPRSSPISTFEKDIYPFDSDGPPINIIRDTSSHDRSFRLEYGPSEHIKEMMTEIIKSEPSLPAPKPKHKRENRYKNAPPSVLSRRRAQNRASQRAYRERKDQRIKDLEVILSETQKKFESLQQAYAVLQAEYLNFKNQPPAPVWQNGLSWDHPITPAPFTDILFNWTNQTPGFVNNYE